MLTGLQIPANRVNSRHPADRNKNIIIWRHCIYVCMYANASEYFEITFNYVNCYWIVFKKLNSRLLLRITWYPAHFSTGFLSGNVVDRLPPRSTRKTSRSGWTRLDMDRTSLICSYSSLGRCMHQSCPSSTSSPCRDAYTITNDTQTGYGRRRSSWSFGDNIRRQCISTTVQWCGDVYCDVVMFHYTFSIPLKAQKLGLCNDEFFNRD